MNRRHTLEAKQARTGLVFVRPCFIGRVFFCLQPFLTSLWYSFHELTLSPSGFQSKWTGLTNYAQAFFVDPNFVRNLVSTIQDILYQVPLVIVYSLFIALMIKGKFHGRGFVRAVFFLPVIVGSGVIIQILKEDVFSKGVVSGETVYIYSSGGMDTFLNSLGMPAGIISYFTSVISRIFDLTWKSGVQILLFLSGLYTISPQLYEAAKMEGSTAWQTRWKVTMPMISPILILNVVYSLIDTFTDYNNVIIRAINSAALKDLRYGYSSALAWIYFAVIMAMIGLVFLLLRKKVFYAAD